MRIRILTGAALMPALLVLSCPAVLAQEPAPARAPDAAPAPAAAAPAADPTEAENQELQQILALGTPVDIIAGLKGFRAKHPDSTLGPVVHFLLTRALVDGNGPAAEIVAEARAALATVEISDMDVFNAVAEMVFVTVGSLVQRNEELDGARAVLRQFADGLVPDPSFDRLRALLDVLDASILSAQGKSAEAVSLLEKVIEKDPDGQSALTALAEEHRKLGRNDQAIEMFIRAETVFEGEKVDGAPLRELYRRRFGTTDGLDAKLASARAASLRRVALDARRSDRPTPAWKLKDLAGAEVSSDGLKGQVVVIDFWATWCGPCRKELPEIQALHEAYQGKGVRVVTINSEGIPDAAAWDRNVRAYVREMKLTATVVNDLDGRVNRAFGIESIPCVFVLDRAGQIRYVNVGYSPSVALILRAQVDSLLAEPAAAVTGAGR